MRPWVAALSVVFVFGSVWISANDHSVDFDPRTDFAAIKTFAVHDATIGAPRPELDNRLFVKKLGDIIRAGLVAKGLMESPNRPDILVDCTLAGKNYSIKVPTGFARPRRRDLLITEGTLVIDLTKAGDADAFWRGVYRDDESAGSKLMQKLPDDAKKLVAEFTRGVPNERAGDVTPVISVSHLGKRYGSTVAVDDVSLEVFEGEIFGLIGPNGAGKTTTMECLQGHRPADRGTISVLGLDPRRDATALRRRIGVQHQEAQLQKRIKVWEAVDLWSSLYSRVVDTDVLLARLGLEAKRNAWFMTLSGGQKQRLFIALALVHEPELVFLDELTTGLDPQARRTIWELITNIRIGGTTVFLTTHLMEEAERLCDRVAIIERGRLIEVGAPAALVRKHCPEHAVVFTSDAGGVAERFQRLPAVRSATSNGATHTIRGEGDDFVTDVIHLIARDGLHVRGFRTEFPTLEDVFLKLTGHAIRD